MKYQKPLALVGGIVVLGLVAYYARKALSDAAGAKTSSVTKTAVAGQSQTTVTQTTPIKTSDVAYVAPKSTLQLIAEAGGKVLRRVSGGLSFPVTTDRMQPFRSVASQTAAAVAPLRPQYKPTAYAPIK